MRDSTNLENRSGPRRRELASSRTHRTVLVASIVLLVASCSGSDGATPTTGEASTTSSAASASSTPPPSTTPETSATAEPTTAPPSGTDVTVPPTTQPIPTTLATDPTETAVAEAYRAAYDSWTECLATLPNCELASLVDHRSGEYLGFATNQADLWNRNGISATDMDTRQLTIESVEVATSQVQATILTCEVDASILKNAQGEDVNAEYQSVRRASVLVVEDGQWKITGSEDLASGVTEETSVCLG